MYKLVLCWRYLRTRYIAIASIISVTLGVATMIVVNAVMSGFSNEMHKRLHGILSDIVVESVNINGIDDVEPMKQEIQRLVGDDLHGITTVVHVPAVLSFQYRQEYITRHVNLIGIDDKTHTSVSEFGQYLLHPNNRKQLSFALPNGGYLTHDPLADSDVRERTQLKNAGWPYRRYRVESEREYRRQIEQTKRLQPQQLTEGVPGTAAVTSGNVPTDPLSSPVDGVPLDPYSQHLEEQVFDPLHDQHTGIILGFSMATVRNRSDDGMIEDNFFCLPGDDVRVTLPSSGSPPKPIHESFTVVDFYESKMSEYDSSFAFVPLRRLQELRGMIDPVTGAAAVTSIQLKLRDGVTLSTVRDKLRARFPADQFPVRIQTWRDMQGPLLAAVRMETTILNILLFLIIAVAGFGILATFFMIVVEKTRDVGILKSLGAPSSGVMSIFLTYGFSLGLAGSGVGMVLGLAFVANINEIAAALEWCTGHEVFDPTVYYFHKIPTIINGFTIGWIVVGAIFIAVMASVLPALRAARLHPVEALRYE